MAPGSSSSADQDGRLLPPVLAVLPCAVCVVTASGRVLAANKAWTRVTAGFGAAAAGTELIELFPEARAALDEPLLTLGAITRRAVAGVVANGGVATWWDLELVPHPDAAGAVIVTARDVTDDVLTRRESEEAQKALSATGARLSLAQEATGIGLWELDLATGSLAWSPGQCRLFGLDPDRDAPPGVVEFVNMVHADDRDAVLAAIDAEAATAQERRHLEFRINRADTGEQRWILSLGRKVVSAPDGRLRMTGINIDITERRREQEALAASEARLLMAFQTASIYAWDWHVPTGRVTWMNGLERALGMEAGSFGGTVDAFRALVHPDDADRVGTALSRALASESGIYEAEFRMRRANGSWRWTRTRGQVLRDASGAVCRIVGIDHDITVQRDAEAALRESDSRLRLAMEAAGLGAWQVDLVTRRTVWDSTLSAMLGQPARELERDPGQWLASVHPNDRFQVEAAFSAAAADGRPFSAEFRVVRPDGGTRILASRGVMTQGGRMVGVAQDVTEARESETRLRESAARLEGMFESLFEFVCLLSRDGTVLTANRAALDVGGLSPAAVIGRKIWDKRWFAAVPGAAERVRLAVADAAAGRFVRYQEEFGGRERAPTMDFSIRPVRDESGAIVLLVAEARDITDLAATGVLQAKVEEQAHLLAGAARELEREIGRRADLQSRLLQSQKLEAMGQLTGGVAHDFNNVLTAIVGSYSLLRRRTAGAEVHDIIRRGEDAARRAARLIDQLLSFARREEQSPEMLDVAEIVCGLEDLLRHAAGPGVAVALDVPSGLWPVLADPNQLGTALLNLVTNARDAMSDGGRVSITGRNLPEETAVAGAGPGHYVAIAVTDVGGGMPPEILAQARQAFFTTKPQGLGTGLGLAMVQEFVVQSRGALQIDSTPGAGTTVEILLPRASILASEAGRMAAIRQISAPSFALHGNAHILLVEDDDQVRPMTAACLRDLGYTVTEAASAEAASVLVNPLGTLDLLIVDVMLPGEDGVRLAQRLRGVRPDLPVLFTTGRQEGYAIDGSSILQKPFSDIELAKAVLNQLGRRVSLDPSVAEPLLSRLSDAAMREMLLAWHLHKADGAGYPTLAILDPAQFGMQDMSFVARIAAAEPAVFQYLSVGSVLADRLRTRGGGELGDPDASGDEIIGTLAGAYRRCLRTRAPVYQSADFDFGDDAPFHFERLILPASENGDIITHLVGVVVLSE